MATYLVEFVGGPFDGHSQCVSIPPDQLLPEAWLPVSANVFRLIDGRMLTRSAPLTSLALYQRDTSSQSLRYRFVGSRPPSRLDCKA